MAKLFANLDKLKDYPRPQINPIQKEIQQGPEDTIRSKFPETLSLADRIQQYKLGTTKHLPQFYLSDLFTGYIKIGTFGVYEHTSPIEIRYSKTKVNQGSVQINGITFNPIQGGVNPRFIRTDSLIQQGTILTNGVYKSLTILGEISNNINQGSVVIKQLINNPNQGSTNIITYNTKPNQGTGINPIYTIDVDTIRTKQGQVKTRAGFFSNISPVNPKVDYITIPSLVLNTPQTNYITFPNIVIIPTPGSYPRVPNFIIQAFENINPNIKATAAKLQTSKYNADRSIALITPTIKHGSENPRNKAINSNTRNSFTPNVGVEYGASDQAGIVDLLTNRNGEVKPFLTETSVGYENVGNPIFKDRTFVDGVSTVMSVDGKPNRNREITNFLSDTQQFENPSNVNSFLQENVTFDRGSFKGRYKTYADIKDYNQLVALVNKREQTPLENDTTLTSTKLKNSEILVTFKRYGGGTISFTAFITSLNDSVNSAYTDFNYVGKQDTFKVYKGTTRTIGLGFKAVALGKNETKFKSSAVDARGLVTKINQLMQIAVVGKVGGQPYTEGPFLQFSLTGLYKNLPVISNSVKVDINNTEHPWDIDSKLPMYYDVSMDLVVLGTQDQTLLDTNKRLIG